MSSSTERINRVLLLWLDLQRALSECQPSADGAKSWPWDIRDPAVARIWDQITLPTNQRALEEWMFQIADGEQEIWAQHALMEARRRGKLDGASSERKDTGS